MRFLLQAVVAVAIWMTVLSTVVGAQSHRYRWTQVSAEAAFAPRDGSGALVFDNQMWLLGGWNPSDKVHFPKVCNNEVWSSTDGKMWTERVAAAPWEGRHAAGCVVYKDKMWIVGGDPNQGHYQPDIWNSADGIHWQQVATSTPWGKRYLHSTVVHDGKIWVMGGQTLPQFVPGVPEQFFNDVWNTSDGVNWTRVTEHAAWPPRGQSGGGVAFAGRMWLLGGGTYETPQHPSRTYYNDVWSSANGVSWQRHLAQAPWEPREFHDMAVFDERIWVLEGYHGNLGGNRNDVWYSADGMSWSELPNTPWAKRHAASVFVYQNALWMVTGNNMRSDVWRLDVVPKASPVSEQTVPSVPPLQKWVDPESPYGLDFYAQGGIVVDGIAYFTANDGLPAHPETSQLRGISRTGSFPSVVAFDTRDFQKITSYKFGLCYDSSPLTYPTKDGTWLVIAHEHKNLRTVAIHRQTGKRAWTSAANQPGPMFFGYTFYRLPDGSRLILMASENGLHAISGETGKDVWHVHRTSSGGVTPCVDQKNGWVFYQHNGELLKLRAEDGTVLKAVPVTSPSSCWSWNTVLTNDRYGSFVATYWYGKKEWDGAIRVYDKDLTLLWEKTGLPIGEKATLTYADGKLVSGSGNQFRARYNHGDPSWKYIAAYAIATGTVQWKCDLSRYDYSCILNVPYYNGFFYAETQDAAIDKIDTSRMFRINAATGQLEQVLEYGRLISSCATCIIARGLILSGDLWGDRIVVTKIAEGSKLDWPGPFGDPQANPMALPDESAAKNVPMQEIGRELSFKSSSKP